MNDWQLSKDNEWMWNESFGGVLVEEMTPSGSVDNR